MLRFPLCSLGCLAKIFWCSGIDFGQEHTNLFDRLGSCPSSPQQCNPCCDSLGRSTRGNPVQGSKVTKRRTRIVIGGAVGNRGQTGCIASACSCDRVSMPRLRPETS